MADSENDAEDPAHFTFIWTIGNICEPCLIDSPTFIVKDMEMSRWSLWMQIHRGNNIVLNIQRNHMDGGPQSIEIKYELSFLGLNGFPIIQKESVEKFSKELYFGFDEFADKHEVFFHRRAELLPKNSLTIRCRMWRTGTEIAQPDMCFARTLLRQDRYFFVWTIREFSTIQRRQMKTIILNSTTTNQTTLYFFITEKDGEEYVGIALKYSNADENECCIMKLCLLDFEGKTVHSEEKFAYCEHGILLKCFFQKKRLTDDKFSLIPNDVLSLRCDIRTEADNVWSTIENYRYLHRESCGVVATDEEVLHFEEDESSNVPSSSFTMAMRDLLEEGTLSDVSLKTGTKSFPAHKCILSARSPFFKSLFTGDMKEKTSKSVEVSDVDADMLEELLSYIYSNTFKDLKWRHAIGLFRAADKYKLPNLKRICSTFLKTHLSEDNVCAILGVTDLYHDRELREAAEEFLMYQGEDFFTSDSWRSFKVENTVLALDVLEKLQCKRNRQALF